MTVSWEEVAKVADSIVSQIQDHEAFERYLWRAVSLSAKAALSSPEAAVGAEAVVAAAIGYARSATAAFVVDAANETADPVDRLASWKSASQQIGNMIAIFTVMGDQNMAEKLSIAQAAACNAAEVAASLDVAVSAADDADGTSEAAEARECLWNIKDDMIVATEIAKEAMKAAFIK